MCRRLSLGIAFAVLSTPLIALHAQQHVSPFEGAWRHVRTDIAAPDTIYPGPRFHGLTVFSGRYYAVVMLNADSSGARQVSQAATTEDKAARYDALVVNAGTFELGDTLFTKHVEHASNPRLIGVTTVARYRVRGDTTWLMATRPWHKDNSKTVLRTDVFVRVR